MSMKWAFPEVDVGVEPLGSRVLVQLRRVKKTTESGIILANDSREHEKHNTQIAKIIMLGPLAFKKRDTMEHWPEGIWAACNEFVRVPKYGGDSFELKIPGETEEPALFMLVNDHELIAKITGDPMQFWEYINK